MTAEDIFNTTRLDVIVPEEILDLPEGCNAEDWLLALTNSKQRDKAFFDERLVLYFTVKSPHPGAGPVEPSVPPLELAQFLSRLQITLDAKYIAAQKQQLQHHRGTAPATAKGINLALPPRSHSHRRGLGLPPSEHTSIFPPHTPNPTPETAEADRQYATSSAKVEGTVLESFVWGETQRAEPTQKSFSLLWFADENSWVAVYRLHLGVSFMRTPAANPLLSLTVSITLREKPLKVTPERQVLAALVTAAGGGPSAGNPVPISANGTAEPQEMDELNGLEEVNLFDGLAQTPTFGFPDGVSLTLPSVRLGPSLRRAGFSLPPVRPNSPPPTTPVSSTTPSSSVPRNSNPVLRKSFLKTLQTVSGFQIRMKSVFVPYVVIPGSVEDEGERREAGSEERTVVLSVELGNGSVSGSLGAAGFAVEGVDVTVGGEGATADLIGWGENGFRKSDAVFPFLMKPNEQFNLLYAVKFLRQSDTDDVADTMRNDATGMKHPSSVDADLQRPVSIVIHGRPFDILEDAHTSTQDANSLSYPTQTFRSRWNCVLDLSSVSQNETFSEKFDINTEPISARDALPAPATPFPAVSPKATRPPLPDKTESASLFSSTSAIAGSKRHTIGGLTERVHRTTILNKNHRASSPIPSIPSKNLAISSTPSSPAVGQFSAVPSILTSNLPSPPGDLRTPGPLPPATPAYPAYPTEMVPPTPVGQSPISGPTGGAGPLVEPHREHAIGQGGVPPTPGPRMFGAFTERTAFQDADDDGDPVVVSVGLLPPGEFDPEMIFTFNTFGIEVFVFNRGERTRRFELSYPDRKRRRHQVATAEAFVRSDGGNFIDGQSPGILPLENRIRIGPLRPYTCQSVRMQFLALQPGVHSIHSLTLTDVETGFSKNLKAVMDVIVHEAS